MKIVSCPYFSGSPARGWFLFCFFFSFLLFVSFLFVCFFVCVAFALLPLEFVDFNLLMLSFVVSLFSFGCFVFFFVCCSFWANFNSVGCLCGLSLFCRECAPERKRKRFYVVISLAGIKHIEFHVIKINKRTQRSNPNTYTYTYTQTHNDVAY